MLLVAAFEELLLIAERSDSRWRSSSCLEGMDPECLVVDAASPSHILCGTFRDGIWMSEDAGLSWFPVGEGVVRTAVTALAAQCRPGGQSSIYAGCEPSALFCSSNGGSSWTPCADPVRLPSARTWCFPPRPYTHHIRWITPDPHVTGRLLVSIEAGALIQTYDGGRSWKDRIPGSPRDAHTVQAHPREPGRFYAAAGDGLLRPGYGYAESDDGGCSWSYSSAGLFHHYLWSVVVHPDDPELVIVSAATGPYQAHTPERAASAIYRKQGKRPWVRIDSGLPPLDGTVVSVLAVDEREKGTFYAANNRGLFMSRDAGASWQRIEIPWPDALRWQRVKALAVVND